MQGSSAVDVEFCPLLQAWSWAFGWEGAPEPGITVSGSLRWEGTCESLLFKPLPKAGPALGPDQATWAPSPGRS